MMARRITIATLALLLTAAPLAASAQTYFTVRVGGPGYYVRYGNGPRYYRHPRWRPHRYWRPRPVYYAPRPVYYAPVSYAAYYGRAPGGWYGWRWRSRWWHHRRWHEHHWMYY